MVSIGAFIGIIITIIVTLVGPIVVSIKYNVKNKGMGARKAWLLGTVGFVVYYVLTEILVLGLLVTFPWFQRLVGERYMVYSLILVISAAAFEVLALYVGAKILQKNMNYQQGMAAGLGYGGMEAIYLGGLTYVKKLVFAILINSGIFDMMYNPTVIYVVDSKERVRQYLLGKIRDDLLYTSDYLFYLAGYERILSALFHIAMSLLICYTVHKKKTVLGVGITFSAHFFGDFVPVFVKTLATPYYGSVISEGTAKIIIYAFLTLVAVGSVVLIQKIGKMWKNEEETC